MVVKLNTVRLNGASLNQASLNGVGERLRASAGGGGGEVIPPEEPDVPDVPVTYTLNASVENGSVKATVNGVAVTLPYTANEGDVVVVEVTANDGYVFEGWSDGNTDNPRSITMTADVTLSATCVVKAVEKEYIQFEDPAVEAVLMANNVSSDGIGITMEDAAKVTSIGTWFKENAVITSFDELRYFTKVTSLLSDQFINCTSLRYVSLDNIVTIGTATFRGCSALSGDLSLPKATTIGHNSFMGCAISSVNAPELVEIKQGAFTDCANMRTISASKVTTIGQNSFMGCSSLEQLLLPLCETIGNVAFRNCTSLTLLEIGANIKSIGTYQFGDHTAVMPPNLGAIVVRATTPPTLGSNGWYGTTCPIYVPDASLEAYKTATNWNSYADRIHPLSEIEGSPYITFADPEVERVLMENNVSSDGVGITMADAQAVTSISAWFGGNTEIVSFEELQYFTGLTSIGSGYNNTQGFQGCESLQYVTLPTSVTEIKSYAFNKTSSLVEIKGADNVAILGSNVFISSGIQKLKLPSVQTINSSFKGCTNLLLLECGEKLTSIASYTFWQMTTGLTTFICRATTPPTLASNNNLNFCSAIYVPDASVDAYKAAANWSTYKDRIKPMSERPRAYDIDKMFQPATTADNSQIINTGIHLFNDFPTWTLRVNVSDFDFSKMPEHGTALACTDETGSPYAGIHIGRYSSFNLIKMDINPGHAGIIGSNTPPTLIIRRNGDILESSTDGGSTYVSRMTSIASVVASSPRLKTIPMIVGGYYDGNGNVGRPFYGRVKAELWEEIIDFA